MLVLFEDCVDRWIMRIELDDEGYICPKFVSLVNIGYQEVVSVFVKSLVKAVLTSFLGYPLFVRLQ